MRQTLTIPDYIPPSLNAMFRVHWARRRIVKRECYDLIAGHAIEQGIGQATGKRRVTVKLTLAGRRQVRDGDSTFKAVLDGLVKAGLLLDDGPAFCELMPLIQERGERVATTIVLEDVP